ncbi:afadin- and alpha-actinin-binding protein-like isoform X2 [Dysidea avara]|uniref:afadin- and alpha-actinin-binding protein-like isoform X2 n=1 Tax=Dysidea avara TaxID=196820 RepID=UPI003317A0EC
MSESAGTPTKCTEIGALDESIDFSSPVSLSARGLNVSLDTNTAYLNQELTSLGFPSLLDEDRSVSFENTIQCLGELFKQYQKLITLRDDLEASLHRANSDVTMYQQSLNRVKGELEASQSEVAMLVEKERQVNKKMNALSAKLKAEEEESRRSQSRWQHKETKFSHEIKKKEQEYLRLKERLLQVTSGRNPDKSLGINMLNHVPRVDGKRSTWSTFSLSQEGDMNLAVMQSFEQKQKDLLSENSSLRESLQNILHEFKSTLSDLQNGNASAEVDDDEAGVVIEAAHFEMPYEVVRVGIEIELKESLEKLKEIIRHLRLKEGQSEDVK